MIYNYFTLLDSLLN